MEKTLKVNTKEIKTKNEDGTVTSTFERTMDFTTPDIFMHETIESLVESLGADYRLHQICNQMKVSWRAKMRNALEKKDDNGVFEFDEAAMLATVYDAKWQPELRITKSDEEKAEEALLALAPDKLEAMMKRYKEIMKKKKA